jgi:ABC-type dipeptide/oligopeptide/nickel transport system permease component
VFPPKTASRKPRLFLIPIRVFLATVLVSLLAFAMSLLVGILGIVIAAHMRGTPADLSFAYRYIAAPIAAIVGAMVMILAIALEIRHHRQSKALAQIERMS